MFSEVNYKGLKSICQTKKRIGEILEGVYLLIEPREIE